MGVPKTRYNFFGVSFHPSNLISAKNCGCGRISGLKWVKSPTGKTRAPCKLRYSTMSASASKDRQFIAVIGDEVSVPSGPL